MGTMIRASNLWGVSDLIRDLGGDPGEMHRRFHIEPDVATRPDAFVPVTSFTRLLETAATELDCPDLGLRLVRWQGLAILGPIAVIARSASTVLDAMVAIGRFLHVHSPALHLSLGRSSTPGEVRFDYRIDGLPLHQVRQSYELSLANGAQIIRLLGGPGAGLARGSFLHEQMGPSSAYAETLGAPVEFGSAWCGFELSRAVAERPIDTADPETTRIAASYLESTFPHPETLLTDRVAELVRRLLPTGQCSIEAVAEQVHVHPRTLQRQLRDEGASYASVLDDQRRDLVDRYLAQPGLPLGQISTLLGYTEQSAFSRSYRRWHGVSPREARVRASRVMGDTGGV